MTDIIRKIRSKVINEIRSYIVNPIYRTYLESTREEVLVLGDSHANVFEEKHFLSLCKKHFFNVLAVDGATVSGLENPNSKTDALRIFLNSVKKTKAKTIITLLGEVDTGFVIWYRAEKYQMQVSDMLDITIQKYQRFLSKLSMDYKVICISTPLPTIRDGQGWGEIANLRKDVKATQLQRTQLTIEFNNIMRSFCNKKNITYLSFDDESLGENGLVHSKLLNLNPNDHHYDKGKYARMIGNEIKKNIETAL